MTEFRNEIELKGLGKKTNNFCLENLELGTEAGDLSDVLRAQEEWITETALDPGPEANRSKSRHRSVERQVKEQECDGNQWDRGRSAKRGSRGSSVTSGKPNRFYEESKGSGKEKGRGDSKRT